MSSWYSRQSLGGSRDRPLHPTKTSTKANRITGLSQRSHSTRYSVNSNGHHRAPSTIDYSNDAPPEMSQLSMSQLSEASSYSSKQSSHHNSIGTRSGKQSIAGRSSQRSSSSKHSQPPHHTTMTPTNYTPNQGPTTVKFLQERSIVNNAFSHHPHGRPASAARVGFMANRTKTRNPYLTKANPYAKTFGSRSTAPQPETHRSTMRMSHTPWIHTRTSTTGSQGPSVARKQCMTPAVPHAPSVSQKQRASHPPHHTPIQEYTQASNASTASSTYESLRCASVPIQHSRSSVSPSFETELMQKAEAEIQKKIESSLNEKITPLVASLEDKQSEFYRLVSKSENHCHELLNCIQTKASKLQDHATDHISDLEAKFKDKTTALLTKAGGELEGKATRAHAAGATLDRKVKVAEKMVGKVQLQMEEANESVAANLEELNESVNKAKHTYKKLVKAAAKTVETSTVALKEAAAKGVASINEASTSFMSSVNEDVFAFAKKSVQDLLGRSKAVPTSSTPQTNTRPRQFISPPTQRPLQDVSNGMVSESSHASLSENSENSSPPTLGRPKQRPSKRKTSVAKGNSTAVSHAPNKKARYASSPSPTLASCVTPSIPKTQKTRPVLKLTRSQQHTKKKLRQPSQNDYNFGWCGH